MKHYVRRTVATILLAGASCGHAQIQLKLELEQTSCLQFEPIRALVTVRNDTDDPVLIGDPSKPGYMELSFDILKARHERVAKRSSLPIVRDVIVEPGEDRKLAVDLTRWYGATEMGRYLVRAMLMEGEVVTSSPQSMIDIVRGIELVSKSRRLPGYSSLIRNYSLRYWKRGQNEYLFLSVDETPSGLNYGVFQLGRIIRVAKPTLSIDADGNIDVRHQCGPDCFIRTTFMSRRDGIRFVDQQYELPDGTPYPHVRPTVRRSSER